ncbi:MAG: alanine:cation symporter family protein [Oscillospiraceae bacterium]|nr:alanine:cation symporter family protein [Oscillospiraceae bacterium]
MNFIEWVTKVNDAINGFVWVKIGLVLLIGTGILMTVLTKFFQVTHIKEWWTQTIGGIFKKGSNVRKNKEEGSVSQFQALCTALAATIGTGNIAGVSSAICVGGPGAVFWMWIAAFFGMMTNFSENVLGIYYRRKNKDGEWSGGPMYYLRDGLGSYKGCKWVGRVLAVLFSIFAVLASFGIGNMGQINKIVINLDSAILKNVDLGYAFGDVKWTSIIIGTVLMIIGGLIILGGLSRIAAFAERVIPFMAIAYIIGSLVVICAHISQIGAMFAAIFKFAFGVKAVAGGITGIAIKEVITQGCKRGVFSNEAGLGSSVMVHSASNVREPVKQGMWGIFEVFMDTLVVCTMTAIVVLSSGMIDLETGLMVEGANDATLVADSFGNIFGPAGSIFVSLAILLFAFTTVVGWSHYGTKAFEYLFGIKAAKGYKVFFVLMMISGAIMTSSLAWDISDTFNGLMMVPNLIGVLALSPLVMKITKNYVDRRIKHLDVAPILSYNPEIEADHAIDIENEIKMSAEVK